jgi:hypothetical protein
MKKNETNRRIFLNRETVLALTQPELSPVAGAQQITTATIRNCCIPTNACPPLSSKCTTTV